MELPSDLETLSQSYPWPAPPPVPPNWKPGFASLLSGKRKPWGDYSQARALIRHGKIPEARELLERILAVPRAESEWGQADVLLGLETMRPPDGLVAPQSLWSLLPKAELDAFLALKQFTTMDYAALQHYLPGADKALPSCPEGAALLLMAFVGASDLAIQVLMNAANGHKIDGMIVTAPVKGLALLLNRQHHESWKRFHAGVSNPNAVMEAYKKSSNGTLSPSLSQGLAERIRGYCRIGLGLVLFDFGLESVRREYFKSLVPDFADGLAQSCKLLA